ncbi:AfsR/SARP family transcriptional regulator [Streptomyces acidiscabies]|uniref:AfsR/SARP family transcriptional regulator n=1 Tax=Streptomyces acidiscabies TaxID=42234 RepID=UPI000959033A|nr:BTAD domain-containing putative transcriptional regulator [Streptomyces acidiscabies]GAV42877.1 regulatory protein AfsR [Streptomyces acidiscabies]
MAVLHVSLLGLLEVRRDATDLDLGNPQQQALFTALLLRRGRTASAADLMEAIWGEEVPASALTTLRTYAWRLRKILETNSKSPEFLVSVGDGYRLVVRDEHIDWYEAERLGREALDAHGPHQALTALERALGLWKGEPLAGIPGPYAALQRDRIDETRLALEEERLHTVIALGQGQLCIPELVELVGRYPLRERLYALLMRAQAGSGRRADALTTYHDARRLLVDELGVDPGAELTAVHRRILSGELDSVPNPHDSPDERADRVLVLPPAQLPPEPADFIGRAHVAQALTSAMNAESRPTLPVVVLAGMGGVGKSSLALHVAHRVREAYPDGQLYADLGAMAAPETVLTGFLRALGARPEDVPEPLEARTALLRTMLSGRRVLIVLDDARDAAQVQPLLPGSAHCGVLITSRTRLGGLPASLQVELEAFYLDEALELLTHAIGAERVRAEPEAAAALMESCACLPLAVRIVAARLAARPRWSIRSLAARLADERRRLSELKAGDLTVSAVFDVTFRQLPADQAHALCLLSCVSSPDLSLASASALLGTGEEEAEEFLESLVDAAVLETPSAGRYRFHSLLRTFAREKLPASAYAEPFRRLLHSLLASAVDAFRHAVPGDPIEDALTPARMPGRRFGGLGQARAWAVAEAPTALAVAAQIAREWAQARPGECHHREWLPSATDLLIALSAYWGDTSHVAWNSTLDALTRAAVLAGDERTEGRARFLRGNIHLARARLTAAVEHSTLAVALTRHTGDLVILRQALNDLGLAHQLRGEFQEAGACYDEAIVLARSLGHATGEVATILNSALLHVNAGDPARAIGVCERLLADTPALLCANPGGAAYAFYVLGFAHHTLEDHLAAVSWYERCLSVAVEAGLTSREACARFRLADSLRALGHPESAAVEVLRSVEMCERAGDVRNLAQALLVLGRVRLALGEQDAARSALTDARRMMAELRLPDEGQAARLLLAVPVTGSR